MKKKFSPQEITRFALMRRATVRRKLAWLNDRNLSFVSAIRGISSESINRTDVGNLNY